MFNAFFKKKKKKKFFFYRKKIKLASVLKRNPQKRSVVFTVRAQTPRKPNSARRRVAKGFFKKKKKCILSYIPGGEHTLKKFSHILSRGGGARDLPGVYTSTIRGKYDLRGVEHKTKRRSIYGVKK